MATSGPGATNLVTAIADAHMDSVPMVAITGQVSSAAIGTDAFQEADITGMTMPVTKHNYLVTDADDIPRVIKEAFHLASTGRPGPVLVDISKDALQASTTFAWPDQVDLPGYRPVTRPHAKRVREAAQLLAAAVAPGAVRRRRRHPRPGLRRCCAGSPTSAARPSSPRSWPAARCPTATRPTSACPACTARSPR